MLRRAELKVWKRFAKGGSWGRVFWLLAITVLLMSATAIAAEPDWLALIYNKAQNAVLMRMQPVPGTTEYKILRSETSGGGYQEIGVTKAPLYKDDTAGPGTTYYYVFIAVTAGGEQKSVEKSVTTPGRKILKLPPPTWLGVTPTVRTEMGKEVAFVNLSWKQERASEAIGFNLYRSESTGADYQMVTSTAPGDTAYSDKDVIVGKTYYYVLTALDSNLEETPYSKEEKAEVKAVEQKKVTKKIRKLKKPIPRQTELLWHTWNEHPDTVGKENRAKLQNPFDVLFDESKGLLYVSSSGHRHIVVLQAEDGKLVKYIGPDIGDYELKAPKGMDLDSKGNLYIVDVSANSIVVTNSEGTLIRLITVEQKDLPKPLKLFDVAVLDDGRVAVSDNANSKVIIFDSSGRELSRWGEMGTEMDSSQLNGVGMIQTTLDGNLAVVNGFFGQVKIFTPEGEFISAFGERKPTVEGISLLSGLSLLPDGQFLITDLGPHLIKQFDSKDDLRQYQADLANEDASGRPDIHAPGSLAVGSKDRVFVVEGMASRVTSLRLGEIIPLEEE